MPHFRPTNVSSVYAALVMATLPAVVRADDGNWLGLGILVIVVPTVLAFGVACLLTWFLCPLYLRPIVIGLCAVPCTPINNGTFYWPLWSYLLDHNLPRSMSETVLAASATALAAYAMGWLAVWLRLRTSPPNTSLERTRDR
jgi:glucan phosphoethanolaminetransferase (alkaline phosphatase superfamily)